MATTHIDKGLVAASWVISVSFPLNKGRPVPMSKMPQAGFAERQLADHKPGAVKIEEAKSSSRSPVMLALCLYILWKDDCGQANRGRDHSNDDERTSSFLQFFEGGSDATMD